MFKVQARYMTNTREDEWFDISQTPSTDSRQVAIAYAIKLANASPKYAHRVVEVTETPVMVLESLRKLDALGRRI